MTWYCTRAWTTYNISKQFPNCFQAKVDSLYGSNPFFQTFFIHRLGNIKVLSKLDPGGLIHWEIAVVCTFRAISVTVSQWLFFCLDSHHMFGWFLGHNHGAGSHWVMTFVVYDGGLFIKEKNRLTSIPGGKGICSICSKYIILWDHLVINFTLHRFVAM